MILCGLPLKLSRPRGTVGVMTNPGPKISVLFGRLRLAGMVFSSHGVFSHPIIIVNHNLCVLRSAMASPRHELDRESVVCLLIQSNRLYWSLLTATRACVGAIIFRFEWCTRGKKKTTTFSLSIFRS